MWRSGAEQRALLTPDAVVVVPGIMGSALYDTVEDRIIWGLRPSVFVEALAPGGHGLSRLAVTEDVGRVEPVGLVKFPTHLPFVRSGALLAADRVPEACGSTPGRSRRVRLRLAAAGGAQRPVAG